MMNDSRCSWFEDDLTRQRAIYRVLGETSIRPWLGLLDFGKDGYFGVGILSLSAILTSSAKEPA
jgi:hypothetical protein